jgi:transcription initiation factor TFIID subunit TAF12
VNHLKDLNLHLAEVSYNSVQKQKEKQDLLCEKLLRETILDMMTNLQKRTRASCVDDIQVFPTDLVTALKNLNDLKNKYEDHNLKYKPIEKNTEVGKVDNNKEHKEDLLIEDIFKDFD